MQFENFESANSRSALKNRVSECSQKISSLHSNVSASHWGDFDRIVFVNNLSKNISELSTIKSLFEQIQEQLEKQPLQNAPDCSEITGEFEKTLSVLKKNLSFEKPKKSRAKEISALEKDSHPELYSSLQQKVLSLLLKTRYLNERLNIFASKQEHGSLSAKSTGKQILELLENKENELQDLKTKYDGIRKKSFMGLIEEKSSVDLESDIGDLNRLLAENYAFFEHSLSNAARQMEFLQNSFLDAKQKFTSIKEALADYSSKSIELSKVLKKERDYAKKIVLDIEHETMQLRGSYTKEILGLQEAKLLAKREAEEKLGRRITELQKQLSEKEDMLHRFKKIAEEKMAKESRLEEQVRQMRMLVKTKQKHDSVKANFRKKTEKTKQGD